MIFEFAETSCILEVLKLLNKGNSRYSVMFKKTKVSHTTLQRVLKELASKNFILKEDIGHQNVNYKIQEKGDILLKHLQQIQELIK